MEKKTISKKARTAAIALVAVMGMSIVASSCTGGGHGPCPAYGKAAKAHHYR